MNNINIEQLNRDMQQLADEVRQLVESQRQLRVELDEFKSRVERLDPSKPALWDRLENPDWGW